ncbi:MAG: RIP metalloprotease RseP [Variibacter sp.]|nr:RIP metalloprotease RseP [Variibacter sp.]
MGLFSDISLWGTGPIGWLIPFLLVLSVIVFFHELGHFLVARWCGVRVLTFSIGFGPELVGFNDRHGTRWKISAVPLGGYVKFFGDENAASVPDQEAVAQMSAAERAQSFFHKSVGQRAAIVVAGPLANFLLAIVIYAGVAAIAGEQVMAPRIDTVQPNSTAAAAGFQRGDVIVSIDGRAVQSFGEVERIVGVNAGQDLRFVVRRVGREVAIVARPELREERDRFGNVFRIGRLEIGGPVMRARVATIQMGSAAAAAGLQVGDLIQAIDGKPIETFTELRAIVTASAGKPLVLSVLRGGRVISLSATPSVHEEKGRDGASRRIGLLGISGSYDADDVKLIRENPVTALGTGVEKTWFVIDQTMSYIARVIRGRESADQIGGPIKIAQVSGQMASLGWMPIISLAAMLSVSIGLLNLFPVPLLDGGHLLFYAIETIRGKPLSDRAQEMGFRIGLAVVLMLMVFAAYNDISGFFPRAG